MAEHNEIGKEGEKEACAYLEECGYLILHRNWRMHRLEIDLIARDGNNIVFVEVRTRSEGMLRHPAATVGREKQLNLIRAAQAYYKVYKPLLDYRFDLVTLIRKGDRMELEHVKNAFRPSLGDLRR